MALNVMLIGMSRNGKSTIGNVLMNLTGKKKDIGERGFSANQGSLSHTRVIKTIAAADRWNGMQINIIDTPGFPDSGIYNEDASVFYDKTDDMMTSLNYDLIVSYINGDKKDYYLLAQKILELEKKYIGERYFDIEKYHECQHGKVPEPTFYKVHLVLFPVKYGGVFANIEDLYRVKKFALALKDLAAGPFLCVLVFNGLAEGADEMNWGTFDDFDDEEKHNLAECEKDQKRVYNDLTGGPALSTMFEQVEHMSGPKILACDFNSPLESIFGGPSCI